MPLMQTMKKIIPIVILTALAVYFALSPTKAVSEVSVVATTTTPRLSHAQTVYKYALEWCESNGRQEAINPNDLDNTPSYGGYQFKPDTLNWYAELYGVATSTKGVMDYEVQSAVVDQMILHRDEINWHQQFPWCVKKLGLPPRNTYGG